MGEFPGFPTDGFGFHAAEVGPALAGLIARDADGIPRAGILPSRPALGAAGTGWDIVIRPFVACRVSGRRIMLGGSDENSSVTLPGAPAANARLDVVYTRPADVGNGEQVEAVGLAIGTAAAVPTKPALPEGAIEILTARTQAGQSSAAQATLTHTFPYTCAAGGTLIVRTIAERNAWAAHDGSRVYCLADQTEYVRRDDTWGRAVPAQPRIYTMTVPTRTVSAGASSTEAITFPPGRFTTTPKVVATAWATTAGFSASVGAITKDGCNVAIHNLSGSGRSIGAQVIAIQE